MNRYVILTVYCTRPQDLGSTVIRRYHANVVRVGDTSFVNSDGSIGSYFNDLIRSFICIGTIFGIPIFSN